MISRILIPILLAIVLSDLYFDRHYWRRRTNYRWWKRLLWWLPGIGMVVYTICLASIRNFIPDDIGVVNTYLLLVGLIVILKAIFALCSGLGLLYCKVRRTRNNWGNLIAFVLILFSWYVLIYGSTVGVGKLDVKHVDIYFDDLPKEFEGYRIALFSDAHVGSFTGERMKLLQRDIDSINAQNADLIAFAGDLQNIQPQEVYPVQQMLSELKAKDGVVSVMGNHDYSEYINADPAIEAANVKEMIARQRQMGWKLLLNGNISIRRGNDVIFIAGEENFKKPDSADFGRTMTGVPEKSFVVMLQHNPKAWDDHIKSSRRVQLTLSGHTHGGQLMLFGFRPTRLIYRQDYGLYQEGNATLYVSAGIGGLVFFRFGVSPEISVITLHKKKL